MRRNNKPEPEHRSLPYMGIPRLLPFLKKYKNTVIFMVSVGILTSVVDTLRPLFNKYALDHFVGEGTTDTLVPFIIFYVLTIVLQALMNYVSTYCCSKVELRVGRDMKRAVFNHVQTLSFAFFNTNNVGYVHSRILSDTDHIGVFISWNLMDMVWSGSYVLFIFISMFIMSPKLGLYLLILVPVMCVIVVFFQRRLVVLHRKVREINSRITGSFNEGITGARQVKTLVVEDVVQADFEKETGTMKKTAVNTTHMSSLFHSLIMLMANIALCIVLYAGGRLTTENIMLVGTLSVFMSYALSMMESIQNLVASITSLIDVQVNIERVMRILDTESDVVDTPEVIEKYGDTFSPKTENFEPLEGNIEFCDVSFRYPDGEEMILEHFNLKVPNGTNVAIVGETGAGKSTLVNLVCRFYEPTEGRILIDGRDVRERSQLWQHSNIGYVLQTPHLFSGSVRENLKYGKPDASDDEIRKALELVSADKVVTKLGRALSSDKGDISDEDALYAGLSADVGEGGDLLSTGEKQLLSFARAILTDPAILVLDEATSSIDTVTEKAIQEAIRTVTAGRTSFMIAHRLSTVVDADVILVVLDGKIIESGRHDELMSKKGYYYELFTRQYEDNATRKEL